MLKSHFSTVLLVCYNKLQIKLSSSHALRYVPIYSPVPLLGRMTRHQNNQILGQRKELQKPVEQLISGLGSIVAALNSPGILSVSLPPTTKKIFKQIENSIK